MQVADYIASVLSEVGITDVFFFDGSACATLIVAVSEHANLNYLCNLHEQAGAFAVDGYYKASGKMSAMIATSGPAGQNLLNGIAASYYDSVPALYITGQINSRFIRPTTAIRQRGFQENDIVSMASPVTKYAKMVTEPNRIRYELEKAIYLAKSGRPGPVLLDIPMDVQKAEINPGALEGFQAIPPCPADESPISQTMEMLLHSQRPAVLLGGGVWLAGANRLAEELIETLGIPFFLTWNMIDFCSSDHPLYGGRIGTFGGDGRNFGVQNCDLLLSVGSRISGRITGGMVDTFARGARKVIVDIDYNELKYQAVKADLNICMDAGEFISGLLARVKGRPKDWSEWINKVIAWRTAYKVVRPEYYNQVGSVNPYVFIDVLSQEMDNDDILVLETGGNCVVASQAFSAKLGQRVFSNNGNSSLGYSLPAAIGACVARKNRVVCATGDGGIQFNIQEFQTLKHYQLPVKVMIFNNKVLGITKLYRDTNCRGNYAGVDAEHGFSCPDFVRVADAYGITAERVQSREELRNAVRRSLGYRGPYVLDVHMAGFYDYSPRLGWSSPIEDQYPFLSRDEFKSNMIIDPVEGWENPVYPGKVGR